MLHAYVHGTNDTAILHGALPLAEVRLSRHFWMTTERPSYRENSGGGLKNAQS